MRRTLARVAALAAALFVHTAAHGQTPSVFTRPWLEWRTLRTEHFEIHFPAEASAWTTALAGRLEGAHARVGEIVGRSPGGRIRIIVEDPSGAANGAAYAFLDRPTISLWPTPPDPRSNIGHSRDAAEQLAVHELAHVAHLGRPSENALERITGAVLPAQVGPIDRKAPRWVTEGYATLVEGRITGSGRPHGALRAALLRQWALEGRLPAYRSLGRGAGFYGAAMAYMAGSAYLEWLAAREGEASLGRLWEAMSGSERRSFEAAFHAVYGDTPEALYRRFTAELAGRAVQVRRTIQDAGGVVAGRTVQRLEWATGDPALSGDGERIAMVLRGPPGAPSRVVVRPTADSSAPPLPVRAPASAGPSAAGEGADALAELHPVEGRAHDAPRFLPDGRRLLVVRAEPVGGGATRSDLFVWDPASERLARVTRGAGIRSADPSPRGGEAAAVRCAGGVCDLVGIDLATGVDRVIAAGGPEVVFHRPRWSPDGARLLVAVQRGGGWRTALVEPATGAIREVGPDDGADRYDAVWLPDGRRAVVVSDRGGIANLEVIDLERGTARTLTRVTGGVMAPEADPRTGGVFFLSLHARGWDLHRIHPDSVGDAAVRFPDGLAPALPPRPATTDTLPRLPLPGSRPYGTGPRSTRMLPFGSGGADGVSLGWMVSRADPIGRLAVSARGALDVDGAPRGLAGSAHWRGWRRPLVAEAWWTPGDEDAPGYAGAAVWSSAAGRTRGIRHELALGASAGHVAGAGTRGLGWVETSLDGVRGSPAGRLAGGMRARGVAGATGGEAWLMGRLAGEAALTRGVLSLRAEGTLTGLGGGLAAEHPTAGGSAHPLLPAGILAQREPMPVLPHGALSGPSLATWRVSAGMAGVRPYLWGARAGGESARVVGVEWALALPPSNVLALPGMDFLAGIGAPWSGGRPGRTQAYFGVSYRP